MAGDFTTGDVRRMVGFGHLRFDKTAAVEKHLEVETTLCNNMFGQYLVYFWRLFGRNGIGLALLWMDWARKITALLTPCCKLYF